jgi:cobaltochelatase CobN
VLPTGRNFYSVDTRAVPTPTAYAMGAAAAERVVERHLQDHGEMLRCLGLSVWGTSTMRTGGEDIAQAFALLGVRPKWADGSSRVVDIEVLPMAISEPAARGRDPARVGLLPRCLSQCDRPVRHRGARRGRDQRRGRARRGEPDPRPRAARSAEAQAPGTQRRGRARGHLARVRPAPRRLWRRAAGTHGQRPLERRRRPGPGLSARRRLRLRAGTSTARRRAAVFEQRLAGLDAVLHNQDNREHDVLDSDDYYQFQGGMAVAVEQLAGAPAALYHGDFSVPGAPRIRTLGEEVARVVRSRAVNPKWLEGVRRHGYKGAFEMAATVDYLFAFDATTGVVGDHQYALVAEAYLHDDTNRAFLQQHNPWRPAQHGRAPARSHAARPVGGAGRAPRTH